MSVYRTNGPLFMFFKFRFSFSFICFMCICFSLHAVLLFHQMVLWILLVMASWKKLFSSNILTLLIES